MAPESCRRGDIVLVLYPHSDLRKAKPRPALVVQADGLGTGLDQVVLCMITSRLFRADHPSRVLVRLAEPEAAESGLLADSVVMTDNMATVLLSEVDRVIGSLSMTRVDEALRHTLSL